MYRLVKICDPGKNFVFIRHSNMVLPLLDAEGIVVFASTMPSCFKFQTMSLGVVGLTELRTAIENANAGQKPQVSDAR